MSVFGSLQVQCISLKDAKNILLEDESHFLDFKSKRIKGKKLQEAVTSFANADGGEVFVGIEDRDDSIQLIERWIGFANQEDANPVIQTVVQDIEPIPQVEFQFYKLDEMDDKGLVLNIRVSKSNDIHYTSNNKVYVRKGAQKLQITGDAIVNLKLSKGLTSYENQAVSDYTAEELSESDELNFFLKVYSPKTEPLAFLKKQRLVKKK